MPSMFTGQGGAAGYYGGMLQGAPSALFGSLFMARRAAMAAPALGAGGAVAAGGAAAPAMGAQFMRYATYAAAAKIGYDYLGGRVLSQGVSNFISDRASGFNMGTDPNQHFYGRLVEATQAAPFGIGERMQRYYNPYEEAKDRMMGELSVVARGGGSVSAEGKQRMLKRFLKEAQAAQEMATSIDRMVDTVKGSESVRNQAVVEFGNSVEAFVGAVKLMIANAPANAAAGVKLAFTK